MAYIQIDLANPKTVEELAVQLVAEMLGLGRDLEAWHIEAAEERMLADLAQEGMEKIESDAWKVMRQETEESGAPKDPTTGRANKDYTKALVMTWLSDNEHWRTLRGEHDAATRRDAQLNQWIQGGRSRLDSIIAVARLLEVLS